MERRVDKVILEEVSCGVSDIWKSLYHQNGLGCYFSSNEKNNTTFIWVTKTECVRIWPDQTKFFLNITVNPTSQNAVCLHWLMSMAHFHDKDECQVKVRWTKFAGFARHPRCSERCVVSVMWRSRPLWDLSRNFVWLSPLSSLSLCLLSPVFPRFLFTFKCAVIPPSALHPTPPNPPRSHDRGGGEGVVLRSPCLCNPPCFEVTGQG